MEGCRTSGQCAPKMQGTLSHHRAVRSQKSAHETWERASKAALCIQKREAWRHSPGLPIKVIEELQHTAWSLKRLPKLNWASGLQRPQPQNSNAIRKPRNRHPLCLSPSPQVTSFKGQPHLLSLGLKPPDPALAPSPGFLGRASAQQPLHIRVTLSLAVLTILSPHCQAFHQSMKGTTNHWHSGTEVQSILDMGQPGQ